MKLVLFVTFIGLIGCQVSNDSGVESLTGGGYTTPIGAEGTLQEILFNILDNSQENEIIANDDRTKLSIVEKDVGDDFLECKSLQDGHQCRFSTNDYGEDTSVKSVQSVLHAVFQTAHADNHPALTRSRRTFVLAAPEIIVDNGDERIEGPIKHLECSQRTARGEMIYKCKLR